MKEYYTVRLIFFNTKWGYPGCFDFEVRCPKCGCTVNYINSDSLYRSEEEAIVNVTRTWNERRKDHECDN